MMEKDALLHQPITAEHANSSWSEKRRLSAQLGELVNQHLSNGGTIQQVQFGMVADMDNSQAAINARTWYLEHPDAVPVEGKTHITDAMLAYALKRLGKPGEFQSGNMNSVAKELGVNEIQLRKAVHKHRARISAKNGTTNAQVKSGRKKNVE